MAMDRRIYLHIGLPKTGTTSLQEILWHHRAAVSADGLHYPGFDSAAHHRAAMDLYPERYGQWLEPGLAGAWDVLVSQVRDCEKTSVISTELLAPASPAEAKRALSSLSFAEVHVVCTARDPARQVPSVWQENIKTRHTTAFPEFLGALRASELGETGRLFWDYQDLPRVLRTWGADLPPERVHVVTVPPPSTSNRVLWQRFCAVIGLDPDGFTTDVPHHNFSLGFAESELLRRLNEALRGVVDWPHYAAVVKDQLAADILSHRQGPTRITLPAAHYDWVRETGQRFVDDIAGAGYDVVGDLADLLPEAPATGVESPGPEPDDSELLDAAVDAIAALVERVSPPRQRSGPVRQLTDALRQLSRRHPSLMSARRAYLRTKARLPRTLSRSA